jgi:hypothetical protein
VSRRNGKLTKEDGPLSLGSDVAPQDSGGLGTLPHLCNLIWPRWRNGKCTRVAGRITIKCIGGYYVVTINCPTEAVQTTQIFESLEGLLAELEQRVQSSTCIWLPDYESQKRARQESKK